MKKNRKMYLWSFVIVLLFAFPILSLSQTAVPGEIVIRGDLTKTIAFLQKQKYQIKSTLQIDSDIYKIQFQQQKTDLAVVINLLEKCSFLKFAEVNSILRLNDVKPPKDTFWLTQWAMKNIGQDSPSGAQGRPNADIDMLKAWEVSKGSKEIVVGVIDTGIDYTHPDLKDNIWVNQAELKGVDGKDDDGNGYTDDKYGWNFITQGRHKTYHGQLGHPDPMDDHAHGTHCAGIIGAKGNNYKGVAGVNWNVRLMALKFLSKEGSGTSTDAYRAVMYAIKNKVDILSNSWGGGGKNELLQYAIKQANEKGILFVVAAGNSASNNDDGEYYPANYDVANVMAVAATDNKDQLATFSSYGASKVHIAAPGVDIMSTIPVAKAKTKKFAYASFSGTSMATPFVAGAAALLLATDAKLKNKPLEIKKRLMSTADLMPQLTGLVHSQGRLNVYNALKNKTNAVNSNKKIHKEPLSIRAPKFNEKLFDKMWRIHKPGATHMRIHFTWLVADIPHYDLIAVYDKSYRLIFKFEKQYPTGFWTPWIQGDTVMVRFANALVATATYVEKKFRSPQDGFKAGAIACVIYPDKTMCYIPKLSDPFANFESQGFFIDKLEYLKREVVNEKQKK